MASRSLGEPSLEVRVEQEAWDQEVGRFRAGSRARVAAERERRRLEREGVRVSQLIACDAKGTDGTQLPGAVKVYVPISNAPASQRPFGFVFIAANENGRPFLSLTAFGERHPEQPGTRSVYERAHKRIHGRYPDQGRAAPETAGRSPRVRSPSRGLRLSPARTGLER